MAATDDNTETPDQRLERLQATPVEQVESIRVYPVFMWARESIAADGSREVAATSEKGHLTLQEALDDAKKAAPEGVGVWVDYSQGVS